MSAVLEFLYCSVCEQEALFEVAPCPDGHGDDCPDRCCTECGYVLAIAPSPVVTHAQPPMQRRVA